MRVRVSGDGNCCHTGPPLVFLSQGGAWIKTARRG